MHYERCRSAGDYAFKICSNIPHAGFVLDRLLSSFAETSEADGISTYTLWDHREGPKRFALDLDGSPIQRVESAGSMVDWLLIDITRKAVEDGNGFLSVHSGVVAKRGRAILLPAAPDSGKTTTVAALTRAGFSYLSDEVALLGLADAVVHPFPRPLVMDESSLSALDGLRDELPPAYENFRKQSHHIGTEDLRPGAIGGPCPVAYVVAPKYRKGTTTSLTPMTRAETMFLLAENAFNLESVRSAGLSTLRRVAATAPGYRLQVGDLRRAVAIVSDLLVGSPPMASATGA